MEFFCDGDLMVINFEDLTPRGKAFLAIDGEREYQDEKWGKDHPHEIDAFATYLRRYTAILDQVATAPSGDKEKLDIVRKIGALAVACMEQHGSPRRNIPYRIIGKSE
jgi:hypothetical protein